MIRRGWIATLLGVIPVVLCMPDSGIVRPRALAVRRLITSSNFVGCSIGRSAGFAPLRILSTYVAERRKLSRRSTT
jgi:hypothetical protein